MAKEVTVKLKVPDWVDEEKVKEHALRAAEELVASAEQSADEARRFFEVEETKEEIEFPEDLENKLLKLRRKRTW